MARAIPGRDRRGGFSVLLMLIVLLALTALVGLAIDVGRMRLAKTELQVAADAAARAAARHLHRDRDEALRRALALASANRCRGVAVDLDLHEDIEFGAWDETDRTFTPLADADFDRADAVRITARRIAQRGTDLKMTFGAIFRPSVDVEARAVVRSVERRPPLPGGIVGIDAVHMVGITRTDSYNSAEGPYVASRARENGNVISNGDLELSGSGTICGEAHCGPQHQINRTQNFDITTNVALPLAEAAEYPLVELGDHASLNDNGQIRYWLSPFGDFKVEGGATFTVPSGTYAVRDFVVASNSQVHIAGPVTFYVTGKILIAGKVTIFSSRPTDLRFLVVGSGLVELGGRSELYADVYAPQSEVAVTGGHDLFGAVIGKTLAIVGNGDIHYDESLNKTVVQHKLVLVQ